MKITQGFGALNPIRSGLDEGGEGTGPVESILGVTSLDSQGIVGEGRGS